MQIAMFVADVPDVSGAFFSDMRLARELQSRGHVITLISTAPPRSFSGGVWQGFQWKPQLSAGRELDQSQLWVAPHYPAGPLIRKLNGGFRRPILFTLHFSGASEMFHSPVPVTWKEAFFQVNSDIPKVLTPQGFPPQVVRHTRMIPQVDRDRCITDTSEADCITLVNANLNKGLPLFLEIAKRMPHKKFLGVRSQYHHAKNVILEVPPNIEWVNFDLDVRPVYAKTRILLVPSVQESFCMVAFEAMLNGIPVLYSKPGQTTNPLGSTAGVAEWISPAGIPCDRTKVDEWVSAIESLDDPEVYKEKSDEVRSHVESIPDNRQEASEFLEAFAREYASSSPSQFKIQNAPPPREQGPVLTAIPKPPANARVGWQNGRLSFGRR